MDFNPNHREKKPFWSCCIHSFCVGAKHGTSTDLQIWLNLCWEILSGWEIVMNLSRPNFKNMTCKYGRIMLSLNYDTWHLSEGGMVYTMWEAIRLSGGQFELRIITSCFIIIEIKQRKHELKMLTLQGTNISPQNGILKMIFLFPRWDMLIPWRVAPSFAGFFS